MSADKSALSRHWIAELDCHCARVRGYGPPPELGAKIGCPTERLRPGDESLCQVECVYWTGDESAVLRVHLERDEDVSGVSGTGTVAYGVVFPDGEIVLRWDTVVNSTVIYRSLEDLERIVSHGGRTRVVLDD